MGFGLYTLYARTSGHTLLVELLGPMFLGTIFNYLLGGVQVAQSYHYYRSYRKIDQLWMKLAVTLLLVTDFVETLTITHASWIFLVDGWGDLNEVTFNPGWGFYATPLMDTFTAFIVHVFYAHKIWKLLDSPINHICTTLVITLSITQLTGGLGCTIFMYSTHMSLTQFDRIKAWATVWLVTSAVTDIVITIIMALKLSRSRTGFKKSDDMISKLIRIMIETGLATAVVQIVDIIVFLLWPLKAYHFVPAIVVPKIYSNSMLALLNSREPRTNMTMSFQLTSQDRMTEGIHIHTTQTVAIDSYELSEKVRRNTIKARPSNVRPQSTPNVAPYNTFPFLNE